MLPLQAKPLWQCGQVRAALWLSSRRLPDREANNMYGWGIVQADKAYALPATIHIAHLFLASEMPANLYTGDRIRMKLRVTNDSEHSDVLYDPGYLTSRGRGNGRGGGINRIYTTKEDGVG